jgi:hypothetical protein
MNITDLGVERVDSLYGVYFARRFDADGKQFIIDERVLNLRPHGAGPDWQQEIIQREATAALGL